PYAARGSASVGLRGQEGPGDPYSSREGARPGRHDEPMDPPVARGAASPGPASRYPGPLDEPSGPYPVRGSAPPDTGRHDGPMDAPSGAYPVRGTASAGPAPRYDDTVDGPADGYPGRGGAPRPARPDDLDEGPYPSHPPANGHNGPPVRPQADD